LEYVGSERFLYFSIYVVYTMRKVKLEPATELKVTGILGFVRRKVTPFGNGAKVDCPKEHLGKTVYLVVCEE
jgi:putative transposon-encoded protein